MKVIYCRGENEKGIRRPILRRFSCQYVKTSINYERHRFYYIYYFKYNGVLFNFNVWYEEKKFSRKIY